MLDKVQKGIIARRPMKNGGIANFRLVEALLKKFIDTSLGRVRLFKPDIIISVPAGLTSVEERAVIQALKFVGARNIYLFPEPLVAALGSNLPINLSGGNMIVNMGGGTVEIAIMSLNGIVAYSSLRISGDAITSSIVEYLRDKRGIIVSERTGNEFKHSIASCIKDGFDLQARVSGLDTVTKHSTSIQVTSDELVTPIRPVVETIAKQVQKVLESASAELVGDIMNRGIVLSGGTSLLRNVDTYLTKHLNIPVHVVDESLTRVVHGLETAIDRLFNLSVRKG